MNDKRQICLVSCVAVKGPRPVPAKDLYESPWFRLARKYVECLGAPWFILSAEHGLLKPDTVIGPYNKTLNTMGVADRRAWAEKVRAQMSRQLPDADEVVILAGLRYRENLMPYLRRRFPSVRIPMEGLKIGEQLSWLGRGCSG